MKLSRNYQLLSALPEYLKKVFALALTANHRQIKFPKFLTRKWWSKTLTKNLAFCSRWRKWFSFNSAFLFRPLAFRANFPLLPNSPFVLPL